MIVEIATFGRIPTNVLNRVFREIEELYSPYIEKCFMGPILELPPRAYNKSRRQYNANTIVEWMFREITGDKVLALTNVDIYVPDKNFVFGLAQYPGRMALVSLKRLDPTFYKAPPDHSLTLERATKESVHELGHIFGLEHCDDKTCVMSFSNSILNVDKKGSAPCEKCREKLQAIFTTWVSR